MTDSILPALIVVPPLLGALLAVVLALNDEVRARRLLLATASLSWGAAAAAVRACADGRVLTYDFGGWLAPYGIVYEVDGIGAIVALLIASIALVVFVYAGPSAAAELQHERTAFLATASLLVAALLGMTVTGDLFNLYVFIEIASITAYTLIASGGGAAALASLRYLIVGTVGASFYLLGLAYLYAMTGTLNMADMALRLPQAGEPAALLVALAFLVTGLGLKMALFPMHGWLPDAYTYAPSAATALIAAVMSKVNALALLRVLYGVLWPAIGGLGLPLTPLLGWLACAGIIAGSVMALAQTDVKRMLAYSSVSHLGYVALGIALGNRAGLIGAVFHILAHAITKGCLFLIAGGVSYRRGAHGISAWAGLNRTMPWSMAAFVVAALSMIGIPPTAGFFGKWYLIVGSIEAGHLGFVVVLLASSLLNAWYFFRILENAYLRHEVAPADGGGRQELPAAMLGPIASTAVAIVLLGVLSVPVVRHLLSPALADLAVERPLAADVPADRVSLVREAHGSR